MTTIPTDAPTSIAFLDLTRQHQEIRAQLDAAWNTAVDTSAFIGGGLVATFEESWADFCDRRHAIGVANGTDALNLILAGLGIGPGHEVILPANTFIATAEAVTAVGATPVFADVDPDTLLVTAATVEPWITPKTAALIAVSLYGQVPNMDELEGLAERHSLALIEDAAQSHAGTWHGRRSGSFGVAAGFSFYPGKNLGAFGDGGAITTDDDALAAKIRSLSNHGRSPSVPQVHDFDGRNSRLDGLQAAILSVKLEHLERWTSARREAYNHYERLIDNPGIRRTALSPHALSSHHLEVIRVEHRDRVRELLSARGVATGIHYGIACHDQEPFRQYSKGPLPVAEAATATVVSLPMHPLLTEAEVHYVAESLDQVVGSSAHLGSDG